ncbi:MAG: hypothetical protein GF381_03170 [Candidatus Pacebacteria bacterium]|nr:hypothetical protein [Candidatus Paceibacterota bacterium]
MKSVLSQLKKQLKKIDHKLDKLLPLLILLTLHAILRIPNLFEPHWYGDEAIYLTVGHGLRYGQKLYAQIVDHKTPIIYYLAMVPSLFWFKFLNLVWMSISLILFYKISQTIFKNKWLSFTSSLLFMLLTTLPWLEGNIANGELFVIGFVLAGFRLLTKTDYFQWLLSTDSKKRGSRPPSTIKQKLLLVGSGGLLGLGLMTKVPAILDIGAMLSIAWFRLINQPKLLNKWKTAFTQFIQEASLIFVGAGLPLFGSIAYYFLRGTAQDYLQYGLLYNFHYAGTWVTDYGSQLANFLMTLKGKVLVLAAIIALTSLLRSKISKIGQFLISWYSLALFATLLSNRPYPHYFLQLIPPLALLVIWLVKKLISQSNLIESGLIAILLGLSLKIFLMMGVHPYPTADYYRQFYRYQTNQISQTEYYAWFNPLTKVNYQLAPFIQKQTQQSFYIWGTNPMLYAQTKRVPTDKFTVAFHVKDLKVYEQTLANIKQAKPEIIVVMKGEASSFPKLNEYLHQYYLPNLEYDHLTLYTRIKD